AQLSTYYVGYTEVADLARDLRAARPGIGQLELHDAMLAHGSPPARLLRTLLLRYRVPPRSRAACPSRKAGQADPVRASGYAGVRRVRACRVEPECGGAVGQASELPQHRRGAVEADPAGGGAGGAGEGAQAGDVDEPEPGHVDGAVAKGGDGADRGLECVAGADVDLAGQSPAAGTGGGEPELRGLPVA